MFNKKLKRAHLQLQAQYRDAEALNAALRCHTAVIEFTPEGEIINANSLFLETIGYRLEAIKGLHHRMFCTPDFANSAEYKNFWADIRKGNSKDGMFERVTAKGNIIWLEATYFPVLDANKTVQRIFKIAANVTHRKLESDQRSAILSSLNRSLAIIEFSPDGTIIEANNNFLTTVGYSLQDIQNTHHRLFCFDNFYRENPDFWSQLGQGEFKSGRFKRKHANGAIIWLEATYNPVYNKQGEVTRIIKFASDITERVEEGLAIREAAQTANKTAEETSQSAQDGIRSLKDAIKTSAGVAKEVNESALLIEKLNEQAKNIEDIVNLIQSISDQTNLLALNAAIEAARAGEYGRGFAVVADEVRELATRTGRSAGDIANVVTKNVELQKQVSSTMNRASEVSREEQAQMQHVESIMHQIQQSAQDVQQVTSQLV